MPQFNLANFAPQLVWLAIFFAILYFGIVRLTLPKIGRVVDERGRRVADDLAAAEAARNAAASAREAHEAQVAKAHHDAQAALAASRTAATGATETRLKALAAELDAKADAAQAALAGARTQALAEVDRIATSAVGEIVTLLTGRAPDEAAAAAAVATAR